MQVLAGWCFVFAAIIFVRTHTLECYQCSQVDDVSTCNDSRICNTGEMCFTNANPTQQGVNYDMGCIAQSKCSVTATGSIIGKRQLDCHECCSRDFCNQALCQSLKSSNCADDEQEDCAKLDSLFGVCNDIHHARLICPLYCNLCDIVDGAWSAWSMWSDCDVTCANGTQTRNRYCNNPAPSPTGEHCKGTDRQIQICTNSKCPVHGGWTTWSLWGSCSVSCDIGTQRRDRSCSNPYPSADGDFCHGESRDDSICIRSACANGNWSTWATWSLCSVTCGTGLQTRQRQCDNPKPSILGTYCTGSSEDVNICFDKACNAGGWSDWGNWSTCSITCGGGIRSRSRTCSNPSPSDQGSYCVGDSVVVDTCNGEICPESLMTPNVGLKARTVNDKSLVASQTLIFTAVMMNYGNSYNPANGIFTVPTNGTYLFTVHLCLYTGKHVYYAIVYDNNILTSDHIYNANTYNCHTADGMLHLTAGQRVWIKCLSATAGDDLYEDSSSTANHWNTFSGMLVHK